MMYNRFSLLLIIVLFVFCNIVYSATNVMPFPAIQQPAPEFTVSALMPNKVRSIAKNFNQPLYDL